MFLCKILAELLLIKLVLVEELGNALWFVVNATSIDEVEDTLGTV